MPQSGVDVSRFTQQYKTATEAEKAFPDEITVVMGRGKDARVYTFVRAPVKTRYGTNPNQPFAMYVPDWKDDLVLGNMYVHKEGKDGFSLTNIQDVSQSLNTLKYFDDPACVAMKHLVPCGAQMVTFQVGHMNQRNIYRSARDCDYRSAFGSVTAFNQPVGVATAREIMELFTEVVVAPGYTRQALAELKKNEGTKKQNNGIRIVEYDPDLLAEVPKFDGDSVDGYLNLKMLIDGSWALETPFLTSVRTPDDLIVRPMIPAGDGEDEVMGKNVPTDNQMRDAITAWHINTQVRSNGVVLVKDGQAISVGTGQQERIGAVEQAVAKAIQKGHDLEGAVLSSDAFFPSDDCVKHAAKYGVKAVIWPAGSMKDRATIQAANDLGVALMVPASGERCFLHI